MKPEFPIFDGHNDTLGNFARPGAYKIEQFFERNQKGHLDLPRAREGGLAGGFFAVYIPGPSGRGYKRIRWEDHLTADGYSIPAYPPLKFDYATEYAMGMTAGLFYLEAASHGQLKVTRTVDEIETCLKEGTMFAILHFEGAEAIDTRLGALEVYYQAGLRSLGPVWSRNNAFAEGVPFRFPSTPDIGGGLTDAGKALVRACNELGVMVDLSHLNEAGFWDVAKISAAPLVATHSNVYNLCRSSRNLTDKQLDAIKESDGMVGLNYAVGFLREDGGPDTNTPLDVLVRHIDYLVERLGIERVGLGSDFDGATMPHDLSDASKLPNLIAALRKAGYDDDALNKITHQNWLRVLRKTWK